MKKFLYFLASRPPNYANSPNGSYWCKRHLKNFSPTRRSIYYAAHKCLPLSKILFGVREHLRALWCFSALFCEESIHFISADHYVKNDRKIYVFDMCSHIKKRTSVCLCSISSSLHKESLLIARRMCVNVSVSFHPHLLILNYIFPLKIVLLNELPTSTAMRARRSAEESHRWKHSQHTFYFLCACIFRIFFRLPPRPYIIFKANCL